MKAILFCLLNLFICFFAQAQTYHSFMHDTAIWQESEDAAFWTCCDPGDYEVSRILYNIVMLGDTEINSIHYKKLYSQVTDYFTNQPNCYWFTGNWFQLYPLGFVREDSAKKVFCMIDSGAFFPTYCLAIEPGSEQILYDFSLDVGDTVQWKPYNKVVIAIDSIQAPNGEFLRRIKFSDYYYGLDIWTEGLGSNLGFFGSYYNIPFECGCYQGCTEASDLLPPGTQPCGGIAVGMISPSLKPNLQIAPNPFSDFVSLTSPFQSSSFLSVINSHGQIILKRRLQPLEQVSFTKNDFPMDNFIFFRLISDEGVSQLGIAVHIF